MGNDSHLPSFSDLLLDFAHEPAQEATARTPSRVEALVVRLRRAVDEPQDAIEMRLSTADRQRLTRWSKVFARRPTSRLLGRLSECVRGRVEHHGPLAPLAGYLTPTERGGAVPPRRVIATGAESAKLPLEAIGCGPHFPGLTDHWQWLRYVAPRARDAAAAPATEDPECSVVPRVLCVIGSHANAPNIVNARTLALDVLDALRQSAALDVRFVIQSDEFAELRQLAEAKQSDLATWLRHPRPNLAVATDSGVVLDEIAGGREILLFLGHSDATGSDPATGLVLRGLPSRATDQDILSFRRLGEALQKTRRTRAAILLACRQEPSVPGLLLEHVDHAIVTDGFVPSRAASQFAVCLLEALANFTPIAEAVRSARQAFEIMQRWHVQHWARTLDPRPFRSPKERAIEVYLEKTPLRPAADDNRDGDPLLGRSPDWHVKLAIDLSLDEEAVREEYPWQRRHAQSLRDLLRAKNQKDASHAGRFVVLGEPGSGKSTMLQRERALLALDPARAFVPVFVRLPDWARDEPTLRGQQQRFEIEDYVAERFRMAGSELADALRERARFGEVCYLLDGLDEVLADDQRRRVTDLLQALAEDRARCPVVVTSRHVEAGNFSLPAFTQRHLLGLDEDQQVKLLLPLLGERAREPSARDLLARFESQPTVRELAKNPLFLTLLARLALDPKRDVSKLRPHQVLDACIDDLLLDKHRSQGRIEWPTAMKSRAKAMLAVLAYEVCTALRDDFGEERMVEAMAARAITDCDGCLDRLRRSSLIGPAATDGPESDCLAFRHRILKEALASEHLAARWTQDSQSVLAELRALCESESDEGLRNASALTWAEPFALMAGRLERGGVDQVIETLMANAATRPIGLRALINAHALAPEAILAAFRSLEDWNDRRRVIEGVVERVPLEKQVPLLSDLASATSEGNDLFFLHQVLETITGQGGSRGRDAQGALDRLYDHLEPTSEDMARAFTRVPNQPDYPFWCAIPAGVFDMGDLQQGWVRGVEIAEPYWIGATPVSVGQYRLFDPQHLSRMAGEELCVTVDRAGDAAEQARRDGFPVVNVTWFACISFSRWLTRWQQLVPRGPESGLSEGTPAELHATLASEARWEYAARAGGSPGQRFWFGDSDDELRARSQVDVGWGEGPLQIAVTNNRDATGPNDFGLFDVHGVVWQWCVNEFDGDPRSVDPGVSSSAVWRVQRGCSFDVIPDYCRSAYRVGGRTAFAFRNFGFRVVLAARSRAGLGHR